MTPEERVRTSDGIKDGLFIVANGLLNDMRIGGLACHDLAYTIRQCIAEAVAEEREKMQAELDATREERDAAISLLSQLNPNRGLCLNGVAIGWHRDHIAGFVAGIGGSKTIYPNILAAIRAAIAKGEVPNG